MSVLPPSSPQSTPSIDDLIAHLEASEPVNKVADGVYSYVKRTIKTFSVLPTEKQELGRGVMGRVHSSRLYRDLVVKKYNHQNLQDTKEELQKGKALDHPNINKSHALIIKHYDEGFQMKLVMDKAEGKTLLSMLRNGEEYSGDLNKKIFTQLKSVFIYLINQNYFWADLNSGNIFLSENGDLKLIDFGAWGEHSRFSKRGLVAPQLDEAIQAFSTLVKLSDTKNKKEILDELEAKKEWWINEAYMVGKLDPDGYLKKKIEALFTLVLEEK